MRVTVLTLLVPLILFAGCAEDDNPSSPSFTDPQISPSLSRSTILVDEEAQLTFSASGYDTTIFAVSFELTISTENLIVFDGSDASLGECMGSNALLFAQQEGSTLHVTVTRVAGSGPGSANGSLLTVPLTGVTSGSGRLEIDSETIRYFDEGGDELDYTPQSNVSISITVSG